MICHEEMWACFTVPFHCYTRQPKTASGPSSRRFAATSNETPMDLNVAKDVGSKALNLLCRFMGVIRPGRQKLLFLRAYVRPQPSALVSAHNPDECEHPKQHTFVDPALQQRSTQAHYSPQPCPTTMGECHPERPHENRESLGLGTRSMCNGLRMYQKDPSFGCTPHSLSWFAPNSEDRANLQESPHLSLKIACRWRQVSSKMIQIAAKSPAVECRLGDHPSTNIKTCRCLYHLVPPCRRDLEAGLTTSYYSSSASLHTAPKYRRARLHGKSATKARMCAQGVALLLLGGLLQIFLNIGCVHGRLKCLHSIGIGRDEIPNASQCCVAGALIKEQQIEVASFSKAIIILQQHVPCIHFSDSTWPHDTAAKHKQRGK